MLQQSSNASTSELREMEKDLDSKVILLWRYTELVYWLLKKNCLLMLQIFSIAHFILSFTGLRLLLLNADSI
jgi:hypothetical protein